MTTDTKLVLDLLSIIPRGQSWAIYCLDCLGLAERINQQCRVEQQRCTIRHAIFQTTPELPGIDGKPMSFLPMVRGRAEIALFLFGFDNLSPAGRCLARLACIDEASRELWNRTIEDAMTQRDSLTVPLDATVSEFVKRQQNQRIKSGRRMFEAELAESPVVKESEAVAVVLYLRQIHKDLRGLVPFLRNPD